MVERGDHVGRLKGLAVMELDAVAQGEGPDLGVGRWLPALCQLAHQLAGVADFRQVVVDGVPHRLHVVVAVGTGVEGIGGRARGDAELEVPAALGRRRGWRGEHLAG
ncbi:hypothetical protein D9M69_504810 [compost metagenome]